MKGWAQPRARNDLRLDLDQSPYEVQKFLFKIRKNGSPTTSKGKEVNTPRWSCLPSRKPVTVKQTKKPVTVNGYGLEEDEDIMSLDCIATPISSRSDLKGEGSQDAGTIASCPTKYFPYRRSGYLDHMIRQSRVNSARVMLCENPDLAIMAPRVMSAQATPEKPSIVSPVRAQTAQLFTDPPRARSRQSQPRKADVPKVGSVESVATKEYTTDYRNTHYTRRKQDSPKQTIKAVRFEGGFQEASISPRPHVAFSEPLVSETRTADRPRTDMVVYRSDMDDTVEKDVNHIPFEIYRPNGQQTPPSPRKREPGLDDYDYKTQKVLSYYLQQERRPGQARFDFTVQNKLTVNRPAFRGNDKNKAKVSSADSRQSEPAQARLGGGFIRFHKPALLHQREDDQDSIAGVPGIASLKNHPTVPPTSPRDPPITPRNLCLLCNCNCSHSNWKMVDAMLSHTPRELTLPNLNSAVKH